MNETHVLTRNNVQQRKMYISHFLKQSTHMATTLAGILCFGKNKCFTERLEASPNSHLVLEKVLPSPFPSRLLLFHYNTVQVN